MIKQLKRWYRSHRYTGVAPDPRQQDERGLDYRGIGAEMKVLQEDADWTSYLPQKELQYIGNADTYACVTFSALNCLEILLARKYGERKNLSDRFTATKSGTTCYNGNWLQKVGDSLRHDGFLYEEEYPNPVYLDRCQDYYATLTPSLIEKAQKRAKEYEITYRIVGAYDLQTALKYAPVQVVIYNGSHAVTAFRWAGNNKVEIFDHYWNDRYLYDTSKISACLQYDIIKKNNDMKFVKLQSDPTVYLVLEDRAFPILEPTTYYALSGRQDWSGIEVITDQQLSSYKVQDRLFTVEGLIKVLNK